MPGQYLTAQEVKKQYGVDRTTLIRWEEMGAMGAVNRTPGKQRRYTPDQISKALSTPAQVPVETSQEQPVTRQRSKAAIFRELGGTGLTRFGGSVQEERLRELQGRPGWIRYREMRANCPVISAIFFGLVNALKQPSKRVKACSDAQPDKDAAEFIASCLDDMSYPWPDTMDLILNPMFEQGFALNELVYKRRLGSNPQPVYLPDGTELEIPGSRYNDGRIGWRKWSPRPAESLADGQEWIFDNNGGVHGINQMLQHDFLATAPIAPPPGVSFGADGVPLKPTISIPMQKLLHFRTTLHPANNPEGMSILRGMWIPYWMTSNLQEVEAIGAERDLNGIPVIYLGEGTTTGDDPNSDWSISKNIVVNLRNDQQAGVVIPHPKMGNDGRGVLLELLSTGGRRNWNVSEIIERYDKRKALSVLAQFIMLGMSQVGSYALSQTQGDLFVLAAQAFLGAVASVINRYAVARLMELNSFPGITGLPEVVFSPVGVPKLEELANFVNQLVDKEVLTPDAELERHLRQVAGLPAPVIELSGEQPVTQNSRSAEDSAMLLRRITMAVAPLQEMGILAQGDGAAMLTPLINELKTSLGVSPISENAFADQVAGAQMKMRYDVATGVPVQKAAVDYLESFTKQHEAGVKVEAVCPLCGHNEQTNYPDHAGANVCLGCGKTWLPGVTVSEEVEMSQEVEEL